MMQFLGLTVQGTRDAGGHIVTYFAIPIGQEATTGRDLVACLADGLQVMLRNDIDEGHEGCTLFRRSPLGLETMIGGHGWSGEWKVTDECSVLTAVTELADHNRGEHVKVQPELENRYVRVSD